MERAIFFDRDGVLNQDSDEFIKRPEELHLLPGAVEAVARVCQAGFLAVVITNQSGIALGMFSHDNLLAIHAKLNSEITEGGGWLAGIYYCPHGPEDGCECRKPKTRMLDMAVIDRDIDLSQSFLIGDRAGDIICGERGGCTSILVLTGKTSQSDLASFQPRPAYVAKSVAEAVDWILSQ